MEQLGFGTPRGEEQVRRDFPEARVIRLDRDSADGASLDEILRVIRNREADVIVGTQMIAKGHDFPWVTLVGVVLADQGMGLPDFRASERTFQLLEQVAGRAGRQRPGRVVIQTYSPTHPAVLATQAHDYKAFFNFELSARRELAYPPFVRLGCVRIDGEDPACVRSFAEELAEKARAVGRAEVLGPAEAPISRLKGRTRWQVFVKADSVRALRHCAQVALEPVSRKLRVSVDIDPVSML
jgi:primosomal protein N' (replication factor Y)